METKKIKALEAVIAALEISENELTNWFNNRGKDKTGLIPTELPLVYRRGNELTVENGLDLSRKSVMVALTCGSGNNVSDTTWGKVKKFAEKMRLNGKPGFLPSKGVLKEHWGNKERVKFAETVNVLKDNEIEADDCWGILWCSEEYGLGYPYFFGLNSGSSVWTNKLTTGKNGRVAVAF